MLWYRYKINPFMAFRIYLMHQEAVGRCGCWLCHDINYKENL